MPANPRSIPLHSAPEPNLTRRDWTAFLHKDIELPFNRFGDKKKEKLFSDLHVLLSSGVDIRTAIDLVESEQKSNRDKLLIAKIKESIIKGASLSLALSQSGSFSTYESVSIRIGEESGQLNEILQELAAYFARKIKLKRQMVSVFSYPFFLLTVTMGVLYFMLNNVVPMFAQVFQRFGKELPPFTRTIIDLSEGVQKYSLWVITAIALLTITIYYQRKNDFFRSVGARIAIRIPLFGSLIRKVYLARFCQSMHLLVGARIPLVEAITLVEQMIGFYPLEKALQFTRGELIQGASLHRCLAQYPIFDHRLVALIKVSEEINQLDTMFGRLAKQYQEDVEYRTSILGSLIEPIMILVIGAIVGVILVAMYQPLFNLSTIIE